MNNLVNKIKPKTILNKNFSGFSLIEVMVSITILGVLAAGVLSVGSFVMRIQATQAADIYVNSKLEELKIFLAKSNICGTHNFGGVNFDPASNLPMTQLKGAGGVPVLEVSPDFENSVRVDSIRVVEFVDISDATDATEFVGKVEIGFERKGVLGSPFLVRKVPMLMRTTPVSPSDVTIDECRMGVSQLGGSSESSVASLRQQVCSSLGGSLDPTTGECNGIVSGSPEPSGSACGYCESAGSMTESIPCKGYHLCPAAAVCPAGYTMSSYSAGSLDIKKCIKD